MCMMGTDELNRAVFEDREMARTFALRASAAPEFMAQPTSSDPYAALPASLARADAVSMPGVRMFPLGGFSSS